MTRPYRFLSTVLHSSTAESPDEAAMKSDFVIILAALLCALVCVVGFLAVAHCAWLRRRSVANWITPGQRSANKGIEKKVLEALPKLAYNPAKEETVVGDCVICLVEYAAGDEIRVLPQCGHGFHVGCIDNWLGSHSSCPSCRQIVVISKCDKCGEFPAIDAGKVSTVVEVEGRERNGGCS